MLPAQWIFVLFQKNQIKAQQEESISYAWAQGRQHVEIEILGLLKEKRYTDFTVSVGQPGIQSSMSSHVVL